MNPSTKTESDSSACQPKEYDANQKRVHLTPVQIAVYWLLAIAVFYTLYFAQTLFLPIAVAALFALLLSPVVSLLQRFYLPRAFSALMLLAMIGVPFTLLGMQLVEPAEKWGKRIPELSTQLTTEFNEVNIEHEYKQFKDYNVSEAKLSADWDSLFRKWLRNAVEFKRNSYTSITLSS